MDKTWIDIPGLRILQHVLFWTLSFFIFLNLFKIGSSPEKIDYIYTFLFHVFILPPVYINLILLIPWLRRTNSWVRYFVLLPVIIALFSWINFSFFSTWSNLILPD